MHKLLADLSRAISSIIPGSLEGESLSGRAYRNGPTSFPCRFIDLLFGYGHCRENFLHEAECRLKQNVTT